MSGQRENIERVSVKIGRLVLSFCAMLLEAKRPRFHMEELDSYVRARIANTAPDSPRRIFNDLRKKSALGYKLLSRRDSFYEVLWVGTPPRGQMRLF